MSNQYLNAVGKLGDVVLSKPIKPMHVIFKGKGTLVQNDNDIIAEGPIVKIYIVYKTSPKTINSNFFFLNCLFGAIKISNTTNSDTDKWQYSGYDIGFNLTGSFIHPDGGNGKNVIIFGADLGNSRHAINKTQSVLVLGHGLIQQSMQRRCIHLILLLITKYFVQVCTFMVIIVIYLLTVKGLLNLKPKILS